MQPARLIPIPVDHLIAETAAFPLAGEMALRRAVTALDGSMNGDTGDLWRAAEGALVGHFPGYSVDEAVAVRDRVWFGQQRGRVPLHQLLRRLAAEALECAGCRAVPRLPDTRLADVPHQALLAVQRRWWRWLCFALPPDLLLAAICSRTEGPTEVQLLSPALENLLADRGFAETHLHLGAAIHFPAFWVRTQHVVAERTFDENSMISPGAALSEGKELPGWLVQALLARWVLGRFLVESHGGEPLEQFVLRQFVPELTSSPLTAASANLLQTLTALSVGRGIEPRIGLSAVRDLYGYLSGVSTAAWRDDLPVDELLRLDPLYRVLTPAERGDASAEVRWLRLGLAYLERQEASQEPDLRFAGLFWQTVRVHVLFYRHLVQRPMTPGLQWFVRFYGRLGPARGTLPVRLQTRLAAATCGHGRGLRSLEIRTSPWHDASESFRWFVRQLEDVQIAWSREASGNDHLELALVCHFVKDRGGGDRIGKPAALWQRSHADPGGGIDGGGANPSGYRYAAFFVRTRQAAIALESLLRGFPLSLQIVRGLDVCADELGVPNWVLAPLLDRVRRAAADGNLQLRRRFGWDLPPLRTTAHAGEDFVHLLTGLRYVDEAVDHFRLREGDRIGHGMALGIDPGSWARRAGRVAISREDRLFDLVWEWDWYGKGGQASAADRLAAIEYEIHRLSQTLFTQAMPPWQLQQLRQDLADPVALKRAGFPDGPNVDGRSAPFADMPTTDHERQHLLYRYLTDSQLFQRGREIIWVEPLREAVSLEFLQNQLRRKLGQRGIVVEINPTSNLLIGDLEDLTSHPLWRLNPPYPLPDDPPAVAVCVGSDDPITFNSHLRAEYQCLHDAMLLGGLSDEQARSWLDRVRACGLESRFSIRRLTDVPFTEFLNPQPPSEPAVL
jgi:hypothetical protein